MIICVQIKCIIRSSNNDIQNQRAKYSDSERIRCDGSAVKLSGGSRSDVVVLVSSAWRTVEVIKREALIA